MSWPPPSSTKSVTQSCARSINHHSTFSTPLLFKQAATWQEGKDRERRVFLVSACAPGFAPYFALRGTSVISLMRINNHGSYLALNSITSHSFWVGVQHNCCFFRAMAETRFPGLIIHSWHMVC